MSDRGLFHHRGGMEAEGSREYDQPSHSGSAESFKAPADLEPLAKWCGDVLSRGLDDSDKPAATTVPPLPDHLRTPMLHHGFDDFDLTAIALALAPDLDPVLSAAIAAQNGQSGSCWPTIALIADLVGAEGCDRTSVAARLSESGPLSQIGLIHIVPAGGCPVVGEPTRGPSMQSTVVASTATLRWVFGTTRLDPELLPYVRDDLISPVSPGDPAAAGALARRLTMPSPTFTSLLSTHASVGLAVALSAAAESGRPVLAVDAMALHSRPSAMRVAAEALLREAVVVVTGDATAVPPQRWESLSSTVVIGAHPWMGEGTGRDIQSIAVRPVAGTSVGLNLVDVLRSRDILVDPAEAERIARWKHLPAHEVGRIAEIVLARAQGNSREHVTAEDVMEAALGTVGKDLSQLADRLETSRAWSQLVLPPALKDDLSELTGQASNRNLVLDELGFAEQAGQPRGLTAVFAGPSGTGKTMAARLVAGELGLPLFRVNLSRTVSKYIGETERNLDSVFAAAEKADAVLLFDEAESLFGKRSEVQDAHDRYANLEIAFLLQRMETYEGVAILATNLLGHLDDAFARRLSFCLHFPFPNEAQRANIWHAVWPSRITLADDLDLDRMAHHPLSGGHIRNIAVAAAHLALSRHEPVGQSILDRALTREYAKLGVVLDALEAVA
jgi:hypothetical protein